MIPTANECLSFLFKKLENALDRKNQFKEKARVRTQEEIMNKVKERGIRCRNSKFLNQDTEIGRHVKIGDDGRLEWPVLLCYPQYSQSDLIEAFHEDST